VLVYNDFNLMYQWQVNLPGDRGQSADYLND